MRNKWIVLLAAAICGSANSAESTPAEWPKECVGRLQLALPGEADQAAILGKERFRDSVMRFPDGEKTGRGENLRFTVTHPLTKEEKINAQAELTKIKTGANKRREAEKHPAIQDWPIGQQEGMGWIEPDRRITLNLFAGEVLFTWYRDTENGVEFKSIEAEAQNVVNGLRPRTLFDVPPQPGLCLPYLFIPDNGQEEHSIAMTYRLKEHPEITVHLKGKTAASTPTEESQRDWRDGRRPEVVTNEYQVIMFWGAKIAREKSSRSLWHSPTMRPMKLAGRPGLETFLAVVWKNETEENYIYHAVARGDPDNPEAAPDVQLVVEQKRKTAIKHGITPLTQDEVLKLAQRIAASVMVRPTR